jgi:hypothetical protein
MTPPDVAAAKRKKRTKIMRARRTPKVNRTDSPTAAKVRKPAAGLTMKEAAIVEACYFKARYAGKGSQTFWNEVNNPANDRTLCDFACALADMEARVLAVLNTSVRATARKLILSGRRKVTP